MNIDINSVEIQKALNESVASAVRQGFTDWKFQSEIKSATIKALEEENFVELIAVAVKKLIVEESANVIEASMGGIRGAMCEGIHHMMCMNIATMMANMADVDYSSRSTWIKNTAKRLIETKSE